MDRLSLDAVKLIGRASELAREFGHSYIGTEHLLLAFSSEDNEEGKMLYSMGLCPETLTKQIELMFGRKEPHSLDLRFNDAVKELLRTSELRHALAVADFVTPAHIFEVLINEVGGTLENICRSLGISREGEGPALKGAIGRSRRLAAEYEASHTVSSEEELSKAKQEAPPPQRDKPVYLTRNCEIPMAEGDFTEAANFALLFARVEAAALNFASRRLDSTCLLTGLAFERSGTAGKLLRSRGITIKSIRGAAGDSVRQKLVPRDLECLIFDANVRRIIQSARKTSRRYGCDFVDTIHLLDAIITSGASSAKTILSQLVDDVAAFRAYLPFMQSSIYEGSLEELELDDKFFRLLEAGEQLPTELIEESEVGTVVQDKQESFDLASLTVEGLSVMECALREYSSLQSTSLDSRHILLGLLATVRSKPARYLNTWGLSVALVRRRISDMTVSVPPAQKTGVLHGSVAPILRSALKLARQNRESKAGPEHIFWALTQSNEPEFCQLVEALGLSVDALSLAAGHLVKTDDAIPRIFSTKFASVTQAGLLIYTVICEPAVAKAMQAALREATEAGVPVVNGAFLLQSFLLAPGEAGEILRSLGLDSDIAGGAVRRVVEATMEVAVGGRAPAPSSKLAGGDQPKAKGKGVGKSGKSKAAKSGESGEKREGEGKVEKALPDIEFAPDLEAAFFKGLALSLQSREPALGTRHLLWGLLESENAAFLKALEECNISRLAILEKLDANRRNYLTVSAANSACEQLLSTTAFPVSQQLRHVLEIAGQSAFNIGANIFDLYILIYALSHAQAGPVADKLVFGGLHRPRLKEIIEQRAIKTRSRVTQKPHIEVITLAVMAEAERLACELGSEELDCEHLMMAILEACRFHPHQRLASELNIDTRSLSIQLCIAGVAAARNNDLGFGPELDKRMSDLSLPAMHVLVNAAALALNTGRNFIDTEQLLLALSSCSKKDLVRFLHRNGVLFERIEQSLARYVSNVVEYNRQPMSMSSRLQIVLDRALELAKSESNTTVRVEDLLIALLLHEAGLSSQALRDLGIDPKELARKVKEYRLAAATGLDARNPTEGEFDLSVFHPDTACLFAWAQNIAEAGLPSPSGNASCIKPAHFLFSLLQEPGLARIFSVTDKKRLEVSGLLPLAAPSPASPGERERKKADQMTSSKDSSSGTDTSKAKGKGKGKTSKSKEKKAGESDRAQPAGSQDAAARSDDSGEQAGAGQLVEPEKTEALVVSGGDQRARSLEQFSHGTRQLLVEAYEQCRFHSPGQSRVRPEHLLLAALAQEDPICRQILERLKIEPSAARERILGYIKERGRQD